MSDDAVLCQLCGGEFRTSDYQSYKMVYKEPHRELEPADKEIAVVELALAALLKREMIAHIDYDHERFLAYRQAVREHFEIPWTAITPRLQRFLYALNAIHQPARLIAAGIFCGNTFIANAGAAIGPGAVYRADDLLGIEIKPEEAARAARNVARFEPTGQVARIVAADAIEVARDYPETIDLLYLDADGDGGKGKGVYLEILEAAYDRLRPGAFILAHNSINCAERLRHYLAFVRDRQHCAHSVNVMIDGEGLEVSQR